MSSAYGVIGLVLLVVAAMAMVQGAWMAITARRPSWTSSRYLAARRERAFGLALIAIGLGAALEGASFIETVAFSGLRLVGIALFLVGCALMFVALRPQPSQ